MMTYDIVLVPFPFTDLKSTKKRPSLILSNFKPKGLGEHSIIAMVTSNILGLGFPFDCKIKEYKKAGLPKPSLIRISKLVTIDNKLIISKLGSLTETDKDLVSKEFKSLFKVILN